MSLPLDISQQTLNEYKEAFNLFDRNNDGNITTTELGTVMRSLGQNPTEAELAEMINAVDVEEFVRLMVSKARNQDSEEELKEAFKVFDRNNNGKVNAAELRHVLTHIGEKLDENEVDDFLREADIDADGNIDYAEFVKILCRK